MADDHLPPNKIVTVIQEEDGGLVIMADDDVSKYEVLGMLRIAARVQHEAVMFELEMVEDGEDPD